MPLVKSSKRPGKKQSPPSVKKPAVKNPAKPASLVEVEPQALQVAPAYQLPEDASR